MTRITALALVASASVFATAQPYVLDDLKSGYSGPIHYSAESPLSNGFDDSTDNVGEIGVQRNLSFFNNNPQQGNSKATLTLENGALSVTSSPGTDSYLSLSYYGKTFANYGSGVEFTVKFQPGQSDSSLSFRPFGSSSDGTTIQKDGTYRYSFGEVSDQTGFALTSANGSAYTLSDIRLTGAPVPEPFVTPGLLLLAGCAAAGKRLAVGKKRGQTQ